MKDKIGSEFKMSLVYLLIWGLAVNKPKSLLSHKGVYSKA